MIKNFISYVKKNRPVYLTELNPTVPNKNITVMKICESDIINQFINDQNLYLRDKFYLNPIGNLFIGTILKNTDYYVNLFCCNVTMEKIYTKFTNYGLAIEGCLNIKPNSQFPYIYSGTDIKTNRNLYLTQNNNFTKNGNSTFLVIDNHKITAITKLINGKLDYRPTGLNVQYVEGYSLYNRGKPFIDFDSMKNLTANIPGLPNKIHGSRVQMNYDLLYVTIDDSIDIDFDDIGSRIKFDNMFLFRNSPGLMVVAFDVVGNILILNHNNSDLYSMMMLLKTFGCVDAILLCNANTNIIWKEAGLLNRFNKTNFIGDPSKSVSNVISFSA